jgi:isopentenyl-diphosphate Delta-isomerase
VEQVVLLDETGAAIGVADKSTVHHRDTPLHLAFSTYVFNSAGELLLTRRAPTKPTWPNVWTNSCCGHPRPMEALPGAVSRRLREELRLTVSTIDLVLPRFRYQATMSNGMVENEMCPVYRAVTDDQPVPDPSEVAETRWVAWQAFATDTQNSSLAVSPWCLAQVQQLDKIGASPLDWTIASNDELPAAARPSPIRD